MTLRYPSLSAFVWGKIKIVKASKINRFRIDRIGEMNEENNKNYSKPRDILPHFKWVIRQVLEQTLN